MFVRKNKNKSGSVSIQVVQKVKRKNKVFKTIGVAHTKREEDLLILLAHNEIDRLKGASSLFIEHDDLVVEGFVDSISNEHLHNVGAELILAKIYQKIGFPVGGSRDYFKNLVL